jgi:hypothetical protein
MEDHPPNLVSQVVGHPLHLVSNLNSAQCRARSTAQWGTLYTAPGLLHIAALSFKRVSHPARCVHHCSPQLPSLHVMRPCTNAVKHLRRQAWGAGACYRSCLAPGAARNTWCGASNAWSGMSVSVTGAVVIGGKAAAAVNCTRVATQPRSTLRVEAGYLNSSPGLQKQQHGVPGTMTRQHAPPA